MLPVHLVTKRLILWLKVRVFQAKNPIYKGNTPKNTNTGPKDT
jgi:hypothetical protein